MRAVTSPPPVGCAPAHHRLSGIAGWRHRNGALKRTLPLWRDQNLILMLREQAFENLGG